MLEAVAGKAELAEHPASLGAEAEQRYARIVATGKTVPWDAMRDYLKGDAIGKALRRLALHRPAK